MGVVEEGSGMMVQGDDWVGSLGRVVVGPRVRAPPVRGEMVGAGVGIEVGGGRRVGKRLDRGTGGTGLLSMVMVPS